jgi:hypothetical protein
MVVHFPGTNPRLLPSSGDLLVLPAVARSKKLFADFISNSKTFREALAVWIKLLSNLGIGAGLTGTFTHKFQTKDVPRKYQIKHPVAIMRANPTIAAILQHYGFPTSCLDACLDPAVSLWFALHAATKTKNGPTAFQPITPIETIARRNPPHPTDTAEVPTLHIYVHPPLPSEDLVERYPLVDLTCVDELSAIAQRPKRQSAFSLPTQTFTFSTPSRRLIPMFGMESPHYRWPTAVIKLYFPFEPSNRADITSETLFPKDEPIYQRLLAARAPHLAIYA